MSHLHRLVEQDNARIRAVDQAAFRLGFTLGTIMGFGFGGFFSGLLFLFVVRG